ncbi:uncharacterized protein LOC134842968 [Symsagittifera roscoffensis]|uniref:uncharacterized protein LOC134842968 n=1 Tax=Symsagittifera roscoffensis TaxID=84072 RepID=UPI00307BAE05
MLVGFLLLLLCLLFSVFDDSLSASENSEEWQSLRFVMPSGVSTISMNSRICNHLRKNYCLLGYDYQVNHGTALLNSERIDRIVFEDLIRREYNKINWFSLNSNESCCRFQSDIYINIGHKKGLFPISYYVRVTDFSRHNKRLNFLKIQNIKEKCLNVILQIGYGTGDLMVTGTIDSSVPLVLPLMARRGLYTMSIEAIKSRTVLSYGWFRTVVICADQPWICAKYASETPS